MIFSKLFPKRSSKKRSSVASSHYKIVDHEALSFTAKEQYKLLRTNLLFTLPDGETSHVIGVTSASRAEGKSTTSINLAYSLAEAGKSVLLMDGDLRLPSIAKHLDMKSGAGLSEMLINFTPDNIPLTPVEKYKKFSIMFAGSLPPNPSELLSSKRMARLLEYLRTQYEYIIIDLPPVNIVSDALAVSKMISGLILVVREDTTGRKDINACVRQINLSGTKILGCVLNASKRNRTSYGRYKYKKNYKYYKYGYGYEYGYGYGYGYGSSHKHKDSTNTEQTKK